MIEYIDPIPPIMRFMRSSLDNVNVYGNTFSIEPELPALLIRTAGGTNYSRIQLIARAQFDYEAMNLLIMGMNNMERSAQHISGLDVLWCEKESSPIPDRDTDTGAAEAWCYMRLEHLEA